MASNRKPSKGSSSWDYLVEQNLRCHEALEPLRGHIQFARNFGMHMDPEIKKEMTNLLSRVKNDSVEFIKELREIQSQHTNKNGDFYTGTVPDTDNAQLKYLELTSRYQDVQSREEDLLKLPILELTHIRDAVVESVRETESVK